MATNRLTKTSPKIRKSLLPYGRQCIDEDDIQAVVDVLRSDWITTGPKVGEFEERLADYVGTHHAVSFSSGTAALHGAVFAAGLSTGDEAIVPPLTFCATSNCLLYQGATPVFADILPHTLALDPCEAAQRITPRTRAIIVVDFAGHPADLDGILSLAEAHGQTVIEDACHALGAEYKGRKVGGLAHMTVFSFHPVKHITTGEGGMVTTNNAELAARLRLFRSHGIASDPRQRQANGQWYYEMTALGYNYRLSDINCALGLSQLRKLDANLARRRAIASRYQAALHALPGVAVLVPAPDVNPAWHLYPVRFDLARLNTNKAELFRAFRDENLGVNVHYLPVHLHPYYRQRFGYREGDYPVAERAYEQSISFPMFHGMTDADVEYTISAVESVVERFSDPQ